MLTFQATNDKLPRRVWPQTQWAWPLVLAGLRAWEASSGEPD